MALSSHDASSAEIRNKRINIGKDLKFLKALELDMLKNLS